MTVVYEHVRIVSRTEFVAMLMEQSFDEIMENKSGNLYHNPTLSNQLTTNDISDILGDEVGFEDMEELASIGSSKPSFHHRASHSSDHHPEPLKKILGHPPRR